MTGGGLNEKPQHAGARGRSRRVCDRGSDPVRAAWLGRIRPAEPESAGSLPGLDQEARDAVTVSDVGAARHDIHRHRDRI